MERENEAHSWSLEIKIENFLDKNNSFKRKEQMKKKGRKKEK